MTNLEWLKSKLNPKLLSQIMFCPNCPADRYCKKRATEMTEWKCETIMKEWCAMERTEDAK